ncbi:MAG: hypothetical protein EP344_12550 [Bacteroidetes bacterium]|nr:MAG: hypothetical protein EP344_12550 [Bacteroidota bacterium]
MILFRQLFLFVLFLTSVIHVQAQDEEMAIKAVINQFFEGMHKGDTSLILDACTEAPVLQTIARNQAGNPVVRTQDFQEFVRIIGNPGEHVYDERIEFGAIMAETALASVWTPYAFYLDNTFSHCGTNSFQLVKTTGGWKIQYIIDTRRKSCD